MKRPFITSLTYTIRMIPRNGSALPMWFRMLWPKGRAAIACCHVYACLLYTSALGEEYIPVEEIYANLRAKHPDVLISWKQGATGTEDFASPENSFHDAAERIRPRFGEMCIRDRLWNDNGVIKSAIVEDEYREALKYINKLYSEGLLYNNTFAQTIDCLLYPSRCV